MMYKGFFIKESYDNWALSFGWNYYLEHDDKIIYCKTIDECKEHIDAYILNID